MAAPARSITSVFGVGTSAKKLDVVPVWQAGGAMWTAIHAGGFHGVEERAVGLSIASDKSIPALIIGFEYWLGCLFHHLLLVSSLDQRD